MRNEISGTGALITFEWIRINDNSKTNACIVKKNFKKKKFFFFVHQWSEGIDDYNGGGDDDDDHKYKTNTHTYTTTPIPESLK